MRVRGSTAACALGLLLLAPLADSWGASGPHALVEPGAVCARRGRGVRTRARGRGRRLDELCRGEGALLEEIGRGVELGAAECAHQFRAARWNCTTRRPSIAYILLKDTRESGFVNGIAAAGVAFAVTRACTAGDLLACSCSERAAAPAAAAWRWAGCGDDVRYGVRRSRDFYDSRHRRRGDIATLVRLHNYNAGRLAIRKHMQRECKCHGLSGSCVLKTCWSRMPSFRSVGDRLQERFHTAIKVVASNDGEHFTRERSGAGGAAEAAAGKQELVYSEESPDFCSADAARGSLGTRGRACNGSSARAPDACDALCCGRGAAQLARNDTLNCRCRFRWCCRVSCDTCTRTTRLHVCL